MMRGQEQKHAFTLAEVLITLGVLGVVAAITLPTLLTNVQQRVQKEQLRSAKYKLTLSTDKMKSLGLLGETYPTTESFINELKKHYKIAKICDNNHLRDCWPTDSFEVPTESDGTSTVTINSLKKGSDLKALGLGTKDTTTMGIITGDGVPMILTYSPKCSPLDQARTYSWSTVDNKPETNATTNCISAVMDINGKGKPNRLGKDVRTWNSILGYIQYPKTAMDYQTCKQWKDKLGIKECFKLNNEERDDDYWAGAVKKCYDIGLHLPSAQTLANIAGARYGRSDITPYTVIASVQWTKTYEEWSADSELPCEQIWRKNGYEKSDQIICIDNGDNTNTDKSMGNDDTSSSIGSFGKNNFWSASESSAANAFRRNISIYCSNWRQNGRHNDGVPLCVGD